MTQQHPLTVRQAAAGDRAALIALNRELQAAEVTLRPSRVAPEAVPDGYVDDLLRREAGGDGGIVVALDGPVVAGFAAWRVEDDALEIAPREVRITDLVVGGEHRRRGVATVLLRRVIAQARARGAARVLIVTLNANEAALAAYRATGFEPVLTTLELAIDRGGDA